MNHEESHKRPQPRVRTLRTLSAILSFAAAPLLAAPINYEDQVKPILRQHCVKCHNDSKTQGGVDLSAYEIIMQGGSAGAIVVPGDPDGSALYQVVTHSREPMMPKNGNKLEDPKLEVIRKWIEGGLVAASGGKSIRSNRPRVDLKLADAPDGSTAQPPTLPENLSVLPLVYTERGTAIFAMDANPWSPVVAIGGEHQVLLYNSDNFFPLGVLPFPEGVAYSLTFSRNGSLLVAGGGKPGASGKVVVWDVKSGERLIEAGDEPEVILSADISADQSWIAFGSTDRRVKVWSIADGEILHNIKKHTEWVTAVRYSPDGVLLATGDRNGGLIVWEAKSGQEFTVLGGHGKRITDLAWRRDSNILASTSEDGRLKLWNMHDGKQVKNWKPHRGGVLSVHYDSKGNLVTSGRDRFIYTWDANGKKLKEFKTRSGINLRARYAFGDERIVFGDWGGRVTVISSAAEELGALAAHPPRFARRIQVARHRLRKLDQSLPGLIAAHKTAEEDAREAAQAWKQAKGRIEPHRVAAEAKKALTQRMASTLEGAKTETSVAREALEAKRKKRDTAKTAYLKVKAPADQKAKLVAGLDTALGDLSEKHESTATALGDAEALLLARSKDLQTNQGRSSAATETARSLVGDRETVVAEARSKRDTKQEAIDAQKAILAKLLADNPGSTGPIASEKQDLEQRIAGWESELVPLTEGSRVASGELDDARADLLAKEKSLEATRRSDQSALNQADATVKALEDAAARLKREVDQKRSELIVQRTEQKRLEAPVPGAKRSLDEQDARLATAQESLKGKEKMLADAKQKNSAAIAEATPVIAEFKKVTKEEMPKKRRLEQTHAELEKAQDAEREAKTGAELSRKEILLYKAAQFDEIVRAAHGDLPRGERPSLSNIVMRAMDAVKPEPSLPPELSEPELDLTLIGKTHDPVPDGLLFFGRFHMVLLHLPIGMLVAFVLLELLALVRKDERLRAIAGPLLVLGALSAVLAAGSGLSLALEGGHDEKALYDHRCSGIATAVLASLAVILRGRASASRLNGLLIVLMTIALILAGHFGGRLTHGPGYLLKYAETWFGGAQEASGDDNDGEQVYREAVEPILSSRCFSCHGPTKTKGGLQLHDRESAMRGGDSKKPAMVPGVPMMSEAVRRIMLPAGHDDKMPPDDKPPLTPEEVLLLTQWIYAGAPGL